MIHPKITNDAALLSPFPAVQPGTLGGILTTDWHGSRKYFYHGTLSFTRAGGEVIVPVPMVTDFGSIPRIFWPFLDPDEFAPAFVPHDHLWRLHMLGAGTGRTLHDTNLVCVEAIATLMRDGTVPHSDVKMRAVWFGINSRQAATEWAKYAG